MTWLLFVLFVLSGVVFAALAMTVPKRHESRCYHAMWTAFVVALFIAVLGVS